MSASTPLRLMPWAAFLFCSATSPFAALRYLMAPADAAPCLDETGCITAGRDIERVAEPGKTALVLLALAMGGFAIGVTEFAAMSVLPDFAAGLGVSEPKAGHVISAYAAGVVV